MSMETYQPKQGWTCDRGFKPYHAGYPTSSHSSNFLGFTMNRMSKITAHYESHDLDWVIPLWLPLLLTALLPSVWIRNRHRRLRRLRLARCPTCGYDLRATPGRCPECGTAAG
jgi:hypothetical protein